MSGWNAKDYPRLDRDFQRSRVYKAEHAFRDIFEEKPLTNIEVRDLLRKVVRDDWFISRFGQVKFILKVNRRRSRSACCSYRAITDTFTLRFPAGADWLQRIVVLHELTHIVTHGQVHGPIFCSVLLQLVARYMGTEAAKTLLRQYKLRGVRLCG